MGPRRSCELRFSHCPSPRPLHLRMILVFSRFMLPCGQQRLPVGERIISTRGVTRGARIAAYAPQSVALASLGYGRSAPAASLSSCSLFLSFPPWHLVTTFAVSRRSSLYMFPEFAGQSPTPLTPVPKPHSVPQSTTATGGVYKWQVRIQGTLMKCPYKVFLVHDE